MGSEFLFCMFDNVCRVEQLRLQNSTQFFHGLQEQFQNSLNDDIRRMNATVNSLLVIDRYPPDGILNSSISKHLSNLDLQRWLEIDDKRSFSNGADTFFLVHFNFSANSITGSLLGVEGSKLVLTDPENKFATRFRYSHHQEEGTDTRYFNLHSDAVSKISQKSV